MLKFFTYTATVAAMSLYSLSAHAAQTPSDLDQWKDQASKAISDKVDFPETANLLGETDSNIFVVTVNRQGDILDVSKSVKAERNYFDAASFRALRYVDLPDLPASYKADTFSFSLELDYI